MKRSPHNVCCCDPAGPAVVQPDSQPPVSSSPAVAAVSQLPSSHALAAVAQLFQTSGGQEVSHGLHHSSILWLLLITKSTVFTKNHYWRFILDLELGLSFSSDLKQCFLPTMPLCTSCRRCFRTSSMGRTRRRP